MKLETDENRIAGSDTTSLTATFTMMLLLNNQEKLKELVEEIDATFPGMEDEITFAKTQDLPHLNAVINESMRLVPIVTGGMFPAYLYLETADPDLAGLVRMTTEATLLGGYEIPKEVSGFLSSGL